MSSLRICPGARTLLIRYDDTLRRRTTRTASLQKASGSLCNQCELVAKHSIIAPVFQSGACYVMRLRFRCAPPTLPNGHRCSVAGALMCASGETQDRICRRQPPERRPQHRGPSGNQYVVKRHGPQQHLTPPKRQNMHHPSAPICGPP